MPARKNKENKRDEGRYFHIYNRGVEKRIIFSDKEDHQVFINFLKDYLTTPAAAESTKKTFTVKGRTFKGVPHQPKNYFDKIELIAYSLMPNHFHLLLHQKSQGSMERFMRSLSTRYSMHFNKKYQRKGSLFEGPYKSAKISDPLHLAYLSRHLHTTSQTTSQNLKGGYSSYAEYLGLRKTPWVKPETAMSAFRKLNNKFAKQVNGYKGFVEEHKLGQQETKQLESIILESESEHLERRDLPLERTVPSKIVRKPKAKQRPKAEPKQKPKTRVRIPELFVAASIFILLLGLGINNIQASSNEIAQASPSSTPTPSVAAALDEKKEEINNILASVDEIAQASPSSTPTPSVAAAQDEEELTEPISKKEEEGKLVTKKVVVIEITDGAISVNLRKGPSTQTEKVGNAGEGETFDFVSENSSWYEFKLDDNSTAFVSTRYAKTMNVEVVKN